MTWNQLKTKVLAFLVLCRNPDFNFVSQCAHIGWGYLLVTLPVLAFHVSIKWTTIPVLVGAACKEYSDAHGGETPAVAGNSWLDFAFWAAGVSLAVVAIR